MAEPHLLLSLLSSGQCRASNQPRLPKFSHARLKSLKAVLDGTVVNSCLCWELFGFLPEFPSGRKRVLICPQQEQVAFTAADWNGKPESDPPPKSFHVKRDGVSVICSNSRSSKRFLKIQNCLFMLIKEERRTLEASFALPPSEVQWSVNRKATVREQSMRSCYHPMTVPQDRKLHHPPACPLGLNSFFCYSQDTSQASLRITLIFQCYASNLET